MPTWLGEFNISAIVTFRGLLYQAKRLCMIHFFLTHSDAFRCKYIDIELCLTLTFVMGLPGHTLVVSELEINAYP